MNLVSEGAKNKILDWAKKYPEDNKKSVVMDALRIAQQENQNTLSPSVIKEVAELLDMPEINVMEVATFYENYNLDIPSHKYQIRICHNISCMLRGADDLIAYLENKLKIKSGEVDKNNKFYLKKVECLGSCVGAPMMQIGDNYYENLDKQKIDDILDNLK